MNDLQVEDWQPCLESDALQLRPLQTDDFEDLFKAASDPLIWEQHPNPLRYQRQEFEKFFTGAMESKGALAVIDKNINKIIGSSRYYEWEPAERKIFVGFTFITRPYWGGTTNRVMKKLMLDHAFQWVDEVWFHVGKDNWRSRKAMEKIGAVYSHEARIEVTTGLLDYVFYKIEKAQWLD